MSQLFDRVVVGLDGREGGRDAIALARALSPGGRLILVHSHLYDAPGIAADAVRLLEHERDATGVDADLVPVADGSPARALQHVAEERAADLLVVGSSHHTRFGRALLGDVGRGVVRHAPCPVAAAPRAYDPTTLARVAVAFDGSPESHEALRLGQALARQKGRHLRLYVIAQLPELARPYAYPDDWARHSEVLRRHAQQLLERTLAEVGPTVDGEVFVGDAARELVDASHGVDLMVVGSRCWGPVRRVISGSTSDHLLHHAACPVLVAPRAAKDARTATEPVAQAAAPA